MQSLATPQQGGSSSSLPCCCCCSACISIQSGCSFRLRSSRSSAYFPSSSIRTTTMTGSYHQKRDLLMFGQQVQRLLVQRIITARNIGKLNSEQMKFLEELLPTAADVQLLLDNYQPQVKV